MNGKGQKMYPFYHTSSLHRSHCELIIWFNTRVRHCLKKWRASSCYILYDVINENGVIKSLQEFSDISTNRPNR